MLISQLLRAIDLSYKAEDKDIKYITDDSRKCREDTIFICHEKGEDFVEDAFSKGAVLVVSQKKLCENCIVVEDTRKAYALLCSAFFGHAHKALRLIGVTGTNGKTTVCSMIYNILRLDGEKAGLISTVKNISCKNESQPDLTTPDCFELHRLFCEMKDSGAEFCIVEASSQGLDQQRLYGLHFEGAVLTNLTSDHLDYHKNFENYKNAKLKLFENTDFSVVNFDDEERDEFLSASKGKKITFSLSSNAATYTAKCIEYKEKQTDYAFVGDSMIHRIKLSVPGSFNVANSLAAIAVCLEAGVSLHSCAEGLRQFFAVRGRMEFLNINRDFSVIIDYAHTEDSLRKSLLFLKSIKKGRLITVFGCGGNRDREKREKMGQTVGELSDFVIVTSDNPRFEEPIKIINDIVSGMKKSKKKLYIHENRKKAIEYALKRAQKNDIIFLAGKGHETSQLIGGEELPFDEREIVKELLSEKG